MSKLVYFTSISLSNTLLISLKNFTTSNISTIIRACRLNITIDTAIRLDFAWYLLARFRLNLYLAFLFYWATYYTSLKIWRLNIRTESLYRLGFVQYLLTRFHSKFHNKFLFHWATNSPLLKVWRLNVSKLLNFALTFAHYLLTWFRSQSCHSLHFQWAIYSTFIKVSLNNILHFIINWMMECVKVTKFWFDFAQFHALDFYRNSATHFSTIEQIFLP